MIDIGDINKAKRLFNELKNLLIEQEELENEAKNSGLLKKLWIGIKLSAMESAQHYYVIDILENIEAIDFVDAMEKHLYNFGDKDAKR
ncbi:MAG: hypothetical protein ACE5RP_00060 [Nitrosopumilus sp.]